MPAVQSSTCIIYNKFAYMWIEIFTTDGDLRNLSSVATEVELKITVFLFYSTTGKTVSNFLSRSSGSNIL